MIHIVTLSINLDNEIYPLKKAQIAHLKANKAFIKISNKYVDFVDVFSPKLVTKLPKHTGINNYTIELVNN